MKKKNLTGSIFASILFISFIFLSEHTINAAKTNQSKDKYVAAMSGLNLRLNPNKTSRVVSFIPFGAKVRIEKSEGGEIFFDGRYGKWVKVKHGSKAGWIFSGFLCDFQPDSIIKPAADFYRNKYRNDERFSELKEYTDFEDGEVSIKDIIENYIVLEIPAWRCEKEGIWHGDVVWKYDAKQKSFFEVLLVSDRMNIYTLYLDNDKYPDLVVKDVCLSSVSLEILLGSENQFINIEDVRDDYRDKEYFHFAVGGCGDFEFTCTGRSDYANQKTLYFFRFNCDKKKYEKYKEAKLIESNGAITSIDLKNMSIVIKDKEDASYKFYKSYSSGDDAEYLKKEFQKGDNISFSYVTIDGEKIIINITKYK